MAPKRDRAQRIVPLLAVAVTVLSNCSVYWPTLIAHGITVPDINDRLRRLDADRRVTALQRNFPTGTGEATFVAKPTR